MGKTMSSGNSDVQPVSSGDSQGRAGFERVDILKINRFIEVSGSPGCP
jgi:hypothetical protein